MSTSLKAAEASKEDGNPLFAMKPADGALPTLRAATDPSARSGSYWGPRGLTGMNGPPAPARVADRAQDLAVAERLWEVSEKLTKVAFEFPSSPARAPAARNSERTSALRLRSGWSRLTV